MRYRVVLLLLCFCVAGMFSSISCYDDDCHNHYHNYGSYWHCHDDDYYSGHSHQTSEVALLITDHPIDDLDAFFVTVTDVTFIEDEEGPIPVYRSDAGRRVDLLSLRGSRGTRQYDLLAIGELPPGVYGSISLTIRDPVMVLSSGEVLDGSEIDLAGGGNIEIDLAQQVLLGPDEIVRVVLDFDVGSSVGLAPDAGGSSRRDVRPLVLVDVLYDGLEDETLTPTELNGRLSERSPETGLFTLQLPGDRGELELRLVDDSEIVDRALNRVSVDALTPGTEARVRGYLTGAGDLDVERVALAPITSGREVREGATDAEAVGPVPTRLQGTVASVALDDRALVVDVDGSARTVAVRPDTKIVAMEVSEQGVWQASIPLREIRIGTEVVVHGDDHSPARLVVVMAD